jgi:putative oxidoreductase
MDFGFLLIRSVIGLTFAAHGGQKLFGWFGGGGIDGTAIMMEQLGLRSGRLHARLAGIPELCGGLLFAFGFLTPFAVAALIAVMLVAIATVHVRNGFFNHNGGFEYNLVLAATALGVVFTGPGYYSIDVQLGWYWDGVAWGGRAGSGAVGRQRPALRASRRVAADDLDRFRHGSSPAGALTPLRRPS